MSDFIEQAEEALEDADFWGSAAFVPNLKTLLRQAITEVRDRDENLECAYSMLAEAKADVASLQAENTKLLEHISGQDFVIDELRVALKEENAACKRLQAENAKLREAARHALELAKIIERGDRIDGDAYASSEIVNTLRAALGSDPVEDKASTNQETEE